MTPLLQFQVGSLAEVAAAMAKLGEALKTFTRTVLELVDAEYRAHGPRNLAADGTWQSDLCAAWVHDSCRSPLLCRCTCHGGSVR